MNKEPSLVVPASFNNTVMKIKTLLCCKCPELDSGTIQHSGAPDKIAPGVLIDNLELEWEIPSQLSDDGGEENNRAWMLAGPAATLKDGVVNLGRCYIEATKLFGSAGSRVLEGVTSTLESTDRTYRGIVPSYPSSLRSQWQADIDLLQRTQSLA